jgi:hypothetical protein
MGRMGPIDPMPLGRIQPQARRRVPGPPVIVDLTFFLNARTA